MITISNLGMQFGGSVLFTSAIEYLTGWMLEKVFHDKWWDYSKRPLNLKGYVCLEFQPSGSYQIRRVWLPENVVSITYY